MPYDCPWHPYGTAYGDEVSQGDGDRVVEETINLRRLYEMPQDYVIL